MLLADVISFYGTLELHDDVLQELVQLLQASTDDLDGSTYGNLNLTPAAFGGSDKAGDLGSHHTRAHRVIAKTLIGVAEDLAKFSTATQKAAELVTDTDNSAATDMTRRAQAASVLVTASGYSSGDKQYNNARNDPTVNTDAGSSGGDD